MSLITAHKILIASAAVLFALYGTYEVRNALGGGGEAAAYVRAGVGFLGALLLALYFLTIKPLPRPPKGPG